MRTRRPSLLLVLALVAAVSGGVAPSASAASPQAVCVTSLSANASGAVYGAGSCSEDGVTVYRRSASGGAFVAVGTHWRGYRAVDVADDGRATFVLMICHEVADPCGSDPLTGRYAVAKLPHGGRPSAITRLGEAGGDGSIAAKDGKWVVAYVDAQAVREPDDRAFSRVVVRGTVDAGVRAVISPRDPEASPEPTVAQPAVAITEQGVTVAFLDQQPGVPAVLRTATVDRTDRVLVADFAPAAGAPADTPAIAVSGSRTFLAWSRAGRLALAFDGARRDLPTRGTVTQVALAASGGRVLLLDSEQFAYAGGSTTRVYLRQVTLDGAVAQTELSAAAGRRDPTVRASLNDVTAARGRPTTSFSDGTRVLVESR